MAQLLDLVAAAGGSLASPMDAVVPPAAVKAAEPGGSPTSGRISGADGVISIGRDVAAIWLVGVFVFAARLVLAALRVRRHARQAAPAAGRVATLLAGFAPASGARGAVRGLVTREPVVPMAWGWLRPAVLLPVVAGCFAVLATLAAIVAPAIARDDPSRAPVQPAVELEGGGSSAMEAAAGVLGTWLDTAETDPADPLEILVVGDRLWIEWRGVKVPLDRLVEQHDDTPGAETVAGRPGALRRTYAATVSHDGGERQLRIEPAGDVLRVEVTTRFADASGRPVQRSKAVYAHRDDFLPNGYTIFFASDSEAGLEKEGVNFGALIAGPHVSELGNSGTVIFGRIDPKPGLPPHPDHAPGFFLIDTATDKATTGLERDEWLAALEALGVESPRLVPPQRKWPKSF